MEKVESAVKSVILLTVHLPLSSEIGVLKTLNLSNLNKIIKHLNEKDIL